jgi:hypothetical protein
VSARFIHLEATSETQLQIFNLWRQVKALETAGPGQTAGCVSGMCLECAGDNTMRTVVKRIIEIARASGESFY